MVQAVIELMLGDLGKSLIAQYNAYHLPINLLVIIYGTLLMWTHVNLRLVTREMEALILDLARQSEPSLDVGLLFDRFCDRWKNSKANKKLFLPTRNDLWFFTVERSDLIENLNIEKEFLCVVLAKAGMLEPFGTLSKQTFRVWELYRHQLLTGMRARHLEPEVQLRMREKQKSM